MTNISYLKEQIYNLHKEKKEIMADLLSYKDDKLVPFSNFIDLKIGSLTQLSKGIMTIPLKITKDTAIFEVIFEKDSVLGSHYHDCYEFINVKEGKLYDLITNRIFIPDENDMIDKEVVHKIKALENTRAIIKFVK